MLHSCGLHYQLHRKDAQKYMQAKLVLCCFLHTLNQLCIQYMQCICREPVVQDCQFNASDCWLACGLHLNKAATMCAGDPVERRAIEFSMRPRAAESLQQTAHNFANQASSSESKYSHIPAADKKKVQIHVPTKYFAASTGCIVCIRPPSTAGHHGEVVISDIV